MDGEGVGIFRVICGYATSGATPSMGGVTWVTGMDGRMDGWGSLASSHTFPPQHQNIPRLAQL